MDDDRTLLEKIDSTLDDIKQRRDELAADPALEQNDHWREHLEQCGYYALTDLSADYET